MSAARKPSPPRAADPKLNNSRPLFTSPLKIPCSLLAISGCQRSAALAYDRTVGQSLANHPHACSADTNAVAQIEILQAAERLDVVKRLVGKILAAGQREFFESCAAMEGYDVFGAKKLKSFQRCNKAENRNSLLLC